MTAEAEAPAAGELFHVPGDVAGVRSVATVLMTVRQVDDVLGWLVRTHGGDHFVLTPSDALADRGIHYAGRRIVEDRP